MGSILQRDKIGTLTEAGSNINLGASILTIGGRQYITTSVLSVALPVLAQNNRYQIYAVAPGGVVQLVITQKENSEGPIGYDAWKLVGCFYSDQSVSPTLGSFLTITGTPRTLTTIFNDAVINNLTGFSQTPQMGWTREGRNIDFRMGVNKDGVAGTSPSAVEFLLPAGFLQALVPSAGSSTNLGSSTAYRLDLNPGFETSYTVIGGTGAAGVRLIDPGTGAALAGNRVNTVAQINLRCKFPIQSWLETPIEDR